MVLKATQVFHFLVTITKTIVYKIKQLPEIMIVPSYVASLVML